MKVETKMVPKTNVKSYPKKDSAEGESKPRQTFSQRTEKPAVKQLSDEKYSNQPQTKAKVEQIKYVKTFNSFLDGLFEMMNLSPDVNDLFRESDELVDVDSAALAMLHIFTDHMPSLQYRENMHFDLNLSANKCSLKTDRFMSFGWYVRSTRLEDNSFDTTYIFHITVFGHKEELVRDIVNAGWVVDTYKKQ